MTRLVRSLALACAAVMAVAATGNWLTTVAETPGGHVLGNPAASTKLIEFVSYTCPHCAQFEKEGGGALKLALVQPGKGSVEVRHIVRDPIDLAVAMLTTCGAKDKFFQNHALFLLRQDDWLGKAQLALPSQRQRWSTGTYAARRRAIAADLGFYEMMATRGYSRAQTDRCLADDGAARAIAEASAANGTEFGVHGTPSFAINGKLLDGVHSWPALEKALGARVR